MHLLKINFESCDFLPIPKGVKDDLSLCKFVVWLVMHIQPVHLCSFHITSLLPKKREDKEVLLWVHPSELRKEKTLHLQDGKRIVLCTNKSFVYIGKGNRSLQVHYAVS